MKKISKFTLLSISLFLIGCNRNDSNSEKSLASSISESSSSASKDISNEKKETLHFSFESVDEDSKTLESVSGDSYLINYVFNKSNQANLFKEASLPLLKEGVKGKSLYMDGFSTKISLPSFKTPNNKLTLSSWVAPRVFENLSEYDSHSLAKGHSRLTSIFNQGNIELGEGFNFGYGRLGMWGIQFALHSDDKNEDFVVGFYDPINTLSLYEWNFLSVTFDGEKGYIGLNFNGKMAYEAILDDLVNCHIIESNEPLYIGSYVSPMIEYGVNRQMISGLLDEVSLYEDTLSPKEQKALFEKYAKNDAVPSLDYSEIALDSSVYYGDRYRPQYHALPPAVWMNEPHSPFYYKGRYHVFYQHNPSGPYWSQIRWGHIVSDDLIHWNYVKDALVPTKGVCPEGVWTGGAVIGPDGSPWLLLTAGTTTSTWSGQNIAYAHPKNPDDPDLVEWEIESSDIIVQPNNDSQGERDQFRDPFIWYDDGYYYLLVSTSIPNKGGSANVYKSSDMRNWEYKGYLYECPFDKYPEQGSHWECVIMLPISNKDKTKTKYVLFDCPQYTVDGYTVDCYYWIGSFDKENCRFIADDDKPKLFDHGKGIFTGQNGFCYLNEEQSESGASYESGRSIIFAIAQGKSAGTEQNKTAGWAHNFAMPLEISLSDDGKEIIRKPVEEISSIYDKTLFASDEQLTSEDCNERISDLRGDTVKIDATFSLSPKDDSSKASISIRYNPTTNDLGTERTNITFDKGGVYVDRLNSSLYDYVDKSDCEEVSLDYSKEHSITILMDRSLIEIYVDDLISFTTRIYPKYKDSDYFHIFDEGTNLTFSSLKFTSMKSIYEEEMTPPYYENTGNLKDALQ